MNSINNYEYRLKEANVCASNSKLLKTLEQVVV